jgi:hypothetical protein
MTIAAMVQLAIPAALVVAEHSVRNRLPPRPRAEV